MIVKNLLSFVKFHVILILIFTNLEASPSQLYLRDNLNKAKKGDYIVTSQSKSFTLLHIYDKQDNNLTIEEISVPSNKLCLQEGSWKQWIGFGAPNHTSWVMFSIDLPTGQIKKFFTFSQERWHEMSQADNFLSTLLNLRLEKIPLDDRKRVGHIPNDGRPDRRSHWQPRMTFEGKTYNDVSFDAWRTRWPKDNSELSGRVIEIYTPEDNDLYPAYFPYWLQISGIIGKAKVRIIDSGSGLISPRPPLPQ